MKTISFLKKKSKQLQKQCKSILPNNMMYKYELSSFLQNILSGSINLILNSKTPRLV